MVGETALDRPLQPIETDPIRIDPLSIEPLSFDAEGATE
jgi:hypothetical protein